MSLRVLIVDDSVVIQKIVEVVLRHAVPGLAEVLHAANGIEGLAAVERSVSLCQPLSLVLCDLNMPAMNGLGFLLEKQRRNLAQGVPVLMITADGDDPQVLQAVAAGAQGCLSKPFTLEQVERCVAPLLGVPAAI